MFGRRQIRERVVSYAYAYEQNPMSADALVKNMNASVEKIKELYFSQLLLLLTLQDLAVQRKDIEKSKFLQDQNKALDLDKFISHPFFAGLKRNQEFFEFLEKKNYLSWDINESLVLKIFRKIISSSLYQNYAALPETDMDADMKFFGKMFLRYIAENDDLHDYYEQSEIHWVDDIHITNSLVQTTISKYTQQQEEVRLLHIFKDAEDRAFLEKLLRKTIEHWEPTDKKIQPMLANWDIERISVMDKAILHVALAEMDFFPEIATRIVINEYIEIAKVFSGEKSPIFINGILDKYSKLNTRLQ